MPDSFHPASDMAEDLMSQGRKLLNLGDYDRAKEVFCKVIRREPANAEAYNKLGVISARLGDLEEAKNMFLKALEIKPDYSSAASNLGNIFFESGDMDKAEEYYKKAAAMDPDNPVPYNNLAVMYKKMKKIDKYVSYYKKSISLENRRQSEYYGKVGMMESKGQKPGRYWWIIGIIIAAVIYFLISGR
ncbi:MAG: tetratricopeptide repeat protein [Tepidanaerobacteraceae bacterium]|jgi:Flp pilus assembly protein TadD|nr:tetratricopeptide repeat protein [Tepidanaerobacteraceae bacterium]